MRKIFYLGAAIILLASCSVFNRSKKAACPVAGSSIGAEQLGDPAKLKKSQKSKFKVKDKF